MARAFLASVPLAVVVVAALVVPLAVIPGTFGFDRWPTSHGPRVSERRIQLGLPPAPVVHAKPAPAEPLRRPVAVRVAVAQAPAVRVRQVAPKNALAPVIANRQSAAPSPTRRNATPAAPAPPPKPPRQSSQQSQPQPEPQVPPPAQPPQAAKTEPNLVAREQAPASSPAPAPAPAASPAPEPAPAPASAPAPLPVERVEPSAPRPGGNGDASGDQGRGTQD